MHRLHSTILNSPHTTINNVLIQHPPQPLLDLIRILHTLHISSQIDTTLQVHLTQASPPIITIFRLLARTMNIPTTPDTLTYTLNHHHINILLHTLIPKRSTPTYLTHNKTPQLNNFPPICVQLIRILPIRKQTKQQPSLLSQHTTRLLIHYWHTYHVSDTFLIH